MNTCQISVNAKRSMSVSITWSIKISILFLIDRALTNFKLTGDVGNASFGLLC